MPLHVSSTAVLIIRRWNCIIQHLVSLHYVGGRHVHVRNYLRTYLLSYLRTYIFTYLRTYLLTPRTRFLLGKLTGFQLVKKFPAFYGTRRFITTLTSVRYLSLSSASSIQSILPHTISWRSVLILSSHLHLGLPSDSFPQVSPTKPCIHPSSPP